MLRTICLAYVGYVFHMLVTTSSVRISDTLHILASTNILLNIEVTAIGCEVAFRTSCSENLSDVSVPTRFDATISLESEVVSIYASV